MLPQLNNKSLLDCVESDFEVLLHNPDYRENQYLDYKADFAFLKISKDSENKEEKISSKISEFRNDICSFANAEGGYIIYGISDEQGIAANLGGVEVENPDRFELELRNKLTPIMPKVPPIKFHFVVLSNGRYLVVMHISHDYYAPYVHIEDQKNYKIYKRDGNQKTVVGYTELKNMFIQSQVLEDEIQSFRLKRMEYYKSLDDQALKRFMLFHIIPESFLNDRQSLFVLEKQKHLSFGKVFSGTGVDSFSLPCVDGLRYENTVGDERAILYNNGVAEFLQPLGMYVLPQRDAGLWFYEDEIWEHIEHVSQGYQMIMPSVFGKQRYYGCISIIGCKDAGTEQNGYGRLVTKIDRNEIIISPISFENIEDEESFSVAINQLHLEYLLSIGIRNSDIVKNLINEVANRQ